MQIQRLNMDNSWLLQLKGLRLLVDPWLEGVEIDFFRWFNMQWHKTQPLPYNQLPFYDAVLITQKYPDHFHQATLKRLAPKRIIAPASIELKLMKLFPSSEIMALSKKRTSCTINDTEIQFFPTQRRIDPIYDAYCISDDEEAIFLAPHGYAADRINAWPDRPVKLLICPFNHYELPALLGGTVSPGIEGLVKLTNKISPRFVVGTHDEDKHASGLVSKLAKIRRTQPADLNTIEGLAGLVLDVPDYQPVIL